MHQVFENLSLYIIPPLLSLVFSIIIILIAFFKMKFRREKVIFILLCIFWSLLSPVFISHQLFRGNEDLILYIEKKVHLFYAYSPAFALLYFYTSAQIGKRIIVILSFILSLIFSLLTLTGYYISGLYKFSWGYMAIAGPAFIVFGAYALSVLLYLLFEFYQRIKRESNRINQMKLKYIFASFLLSGILTLMNYPAMLGIDFYPVGNFSFIPLAFLVYGVLKYRLLDFKSAFEITTAWAAISTVIVIPNLLFFYFLQLYIMYINSVGLFFIALVCFLFNYHYFKRVQPVMGRLFNKRRIELKKMRQEFLYNIYILKSADELLLQLSEVITKAFNAEIVYILYYSAGQKPLSAKPGLVLSDRLRSWLIENNQVLEKEILINSPVYAAHRNEWFNLFTEYKSDYAIPLIHRDQLISLAFFSVHRPGVTLTPDETGFLDMVKSSAAVSLSNAFLYSDLAELKENLEERVKERTADLESSMNALLTVIDRLEKEDKDRVVSYFTEKKIDEIKSYIDENFREEITRESLAKKMNLNADYLGRSFKKITGNNINEYIHDLRINNACSLLAETDDSIIDIAFASGYESLPTFYRMFKKKSGQSPVQFRENLKNGTIQE